MQADPCVKSVTLHHDFSKGNKKKDTWNNEGVLIRAQLYDITFFMFVCRSTSLTNITIKSTINKDERWYFFVAEWLKQSQKKLLWNAWRIVETCQHWLDYMNSKWNSKYCLEQSIYLCVIELAGIDRLCQNSNPISCTRINGVCAQRRKA